MLVSKVAKRYAQGLLEFSNENNTVSQVFDEMKSVISILNSSKELNSFLVTPFVDAKKKEETANLIFSSFSEGSKNFIRLVIKHGREAQLKNIAQEFINKVEDINGIQRITLTTATELSPSNIDAILKSTSIVNHNNKFDVQTIINTELLGGYILRVGDLQIDASVKSKLNHLKKEFNLN
ncbi:MAG: ATP synthase F1 subunit delta [Bacteroidetes bacterium]|nr:ATP synthase F1 subunit delta [Bacteroidota bacterium]